ncbi:type IV pili methyl-accepting chemotaxis transducer N-terminal domain-containing protein [Reichenbachiella ulvae]|uniref:Type IV pili methyl-accepting chemotaxis transducer N-terminal domain-containing protein n=1 Tax=Reichenbachiella ulvae TaxID=2980104 RepID=A0ABT3CX91_9BACT|nr:type IV pili methyl-accepting chemotaxis transducer N-terminal domain-containing protein [Reichenbachiella ulvae]MCV9388178.1 type IV pili methyl-accepting chemotaxis transducer N-terminal domain-containing protein [Reichenbachiella ulvae]
MKKLSVQYLIFLGILTVAIVTSQILIQKAISDSKTDSRIINISGRQRMLSQKITKAALKLQSCETRQEFYETKLELTNAADLWSRSHEALKHGNESLDVTEMNQSATLNKLFTQIEPFYSSIIGAVENVKKLGYSASQSGEQEETLAESVKIISGNEASFLKLMNDITFEYDHLAAQKVEELSSSEFYLLAVALLLIVLEAFFIFRPMIKNSKKKDSEISELHDYVQKSISFIGKSQEGENQIKEAEEKIKMLTEENVQLSMIVKSLENSKIVATGDQIIKDSQIEQLNKKYEKKIKGLERELAKIKTAL